MTNELKISHPVYEFQSPTEFFQSKSNIWPIDWFLVAFFVFLNQSTSTSLAIPSWVFIVRGQGDKLLEFQLLYGW